MDDDDPRIAHLRTLLSTQEGVETFRRWTVLSMNAAQFPLGAIAAAVDLSEDEVEERYQSELKAWWRFNELMDRVNRRCAIERASPAATAAALLRAAAGPLAPLPSKHHDTETKGA